MMKAILALIFLISLFGVLVMLFVHIWWINSDIRIISTFLLSTIIFGAAFSKWPSTKETIKNDN